MSMIRTLQRTYCEKILPDEMIFFAINSYKNYKIQNTAKYLCMCIYIYVYIYVYVCIYWVVWKVRADVEGKLKYRKLKF